MTCPTRIFSNLSGPVKFVAATRLRKMSVFTNLPHRSLPGLQKLLEQVLGCPMLLVLSGIGATVD
jgi:hypothetical protein